MVITACLCFLVEMVGFSIIIGMGDRLFSIVVSTSDCHPRGPVFDSRLYPRNFSESIGTGTGSTQPCEENWVAT